MKNFLCIKISLLFLCLQLSLPSYATDIIEDRVAIESFKGQELTKPVYTLQLIEDNFVSQSFQGMNLLKPVYKYVFLEDRVALETFAGKHLYRPVYKCKLLDENSKDIEVVVASNSTIATNHAHFELINGLNLGVGRDIGESVRFRVEKDVIKDGNLFIRRGTPIDAIIGDIVPSSSRGAPAEVSIEQFITHDVYGNSVELLGNVTKRGLSLTLPLYLLAAGGYFFTAGFSQYILLLHGFQAKIKPRQRFTIYYEG